jgi:hypothetical protein
MITVGAGPSITPYPKRYLFFIVLTPKNKQHIFTTFKTIGQQDGTSSERIHAIDFGFAFVF